MKFFFQQFGDNSLVLLAVFLSAVLFAYAIAGMTSSWFAVRRRATGGLGVLFADLPTSGAISLFGVQNSTSLSVLLPRSGKSKSDLRQFMELAGYRSAIAPAVFQFVRLAVGAALGLVTPFYCGQLLPDLPFWTVAAISIAIAFLGYMLPKTIVSLKRDKLLEEHRIGFPDFLDLLVICVEAGIGVDSGINRISSELSRDYPSLSWNLALMSAELRAGRSMRDALQQMAERLGIPEGKAFATLVQQSEELGSSLVQTLRVYSEDMRHKRFSRAEEKAHALPVKMIIPLGFFCFPTIMGVTLFPIALQISRSFV